MPEQLSRERLHTIIRMIVSARGPKVADEIADHIAALEAENAEWKASFDLYNKAIRRGDDAWRQAHPDMDCYPDTGEMVKWLCDRNDALEAENERLRAVVEAAKALIADPEWCSCSTINPNSRHAHDRPNLDYPATCAICGPTYCTGRTLNDALAALDEEGE